MLPKAERAGEVPGFPLFLPLVFYSRLPLAESAQKPENRSQNSKSNDQQVKEHNS